jgi:cell division protein FtsQ
MLTLVIGAVYVSLFDGVLNTPIEFVDIEGALDAWEMKIVRRKLSEQDLGRVTIGELKPVLEEIGWVHHVNVKKVSPGFLKVQVVKQKAVAEWLDGGYLNGEGRLFAAGRKIATKLPILNGPKGAEKLMMTQFQQLNKALKKTGLSIRRLTLEDRAEWILQLKSAITVKLGKESISERMQRLITVYEAAGLANEVTRIAEIDTRYPNGIAVSWKDNKCTGSCYQFAGNNNLKRKQAL